MGVFVMKKAIAIILAFVFILSLVACSPAKEENKTNIQ